MGGKHDNANNAGLAQFAIKAGAGAPGLRVVRETNGRDRRPIGSSWPWPGSPPSSWTVCEVCPRAPESLADGDRLPLMWFGRFMIGNVVEEDTPLESLLFYPHLSIAITAGRSSSSGWPAGSRTERRPFRPRDDRSRGPAPTSPMRRSTAGVRKTAGRQGSTHIAAWQPANRRAGEERHTDALRRSPHDRSTEAGLTAAQRGQGGSIRVDTHDPDEFAKSLFAGEVKRREPEEPRLARDTSSFRPWHSAAQSASREGLQRWRAAVLSHGRHPFLPGASTMSVPYSKPQSGRRGPRRSRVRARTPTTSSDEALSLSSHEVAPRDPRVFPIRIVARSGPTSR